MRSLANDRHTAFVRQNDPAESSRDYGVLPPVRKGGVTNMCR